MTSLPLAQEISLLSTWPLSPLFSYNLTFTVDILKEKLFAYVHGGMNIDDSMAILKIVLPSWQWPLAQAEILWLFLQTLSVSVALNSPVSTLNAFISGIGCTLPKRFTGVDDRRDYSQAIDVGTLGKGIKLGTIRILVWVMGFMAHGYATEEFEVWLLLFIVGLVRWCLKNWFNKSDGLCLDDFNFISLRIVFLLCFTHTGLYWLQVNIERLGVYRPEEHIGISNQKFILM